MVGPNSPASDSIIAPENSLGHQQQDLSAIRTNAPESNVRERWPSESFSGTLPSLQPVSNHQQRQQQPHRLAPLLPQTSSPKQQVPSLPPPIPQTQTQPPTSTSSNSRILPPPTPLSERGAELEVDAMGASTGIIPPDPRGENRVGDNDNRQGYFGSSSAMSFMREVREVIGKKTTFSADENRSNRGSPSRRLSQSSRSSRNTSSAGGGPRSIVDTHTSIANNYNNNGNNIHAGSQSRSYSICHDYVLPPRKVADSLVRSYWTFVHTLYPFLHKPAFMKTYSRLWSYPEDGKSVLLER